MDNKLPQFPSDEFFNFYNGLPVENETINEWIKECYEDLQEGDIYSSGRASGNTKVEVTKYIYKDVPQYEVYISQGYYKASFHD